MKQRMIDFSEAEVYIKEWFTPDELANNLRYFALKTFVTCAHDADYMKSLLTAIDDTCDLLDRIQVKEVEA